MRRLLAGALLAFGVAACVSVNENVASLSEVSDDAVLLVGKIEIVPPIKAKDQTYDAGVDLFNSKRYFVGRALMFMSERPEYQRHTGLALNPPLEETFFVKLPRSQRYMVKGSVTMELVSRGSSARSGFDHTELMFPSPIQIDVRPGDSAIYIGTLRLYRDEFHEVTKVELRDQYAQGAAEFRGKFAGAPLPRKALLKLPK